MTPIHHLFSSLRRNPLILSLSKGARHLHGAAGFTLVEMLAALAVVALLLPLMGSAIRSISLGTDRNTTLVTGLTQVNSGARVISRDILKALDTDLAVGVPAASSMILYWTDWSDTTNMDSYSSGGIAYKRIRVTYSIVGTSLRATMATCANSDSSDVKCDPGVPGAAWSDNTQWVSGVAVLDSAGNFNPASREADPASPRTVARYVTSVQFLRDASGYITATVTSSADATLWPNQARTYDLKAYASLLGTTTPIR